MRYFSIFLVIFWLNISAFASSGINLVPNPGFERDSDFNSIPDFWDVKKSSSAVSKIEFRGKIGKCVSIFGRGIYICKLRRLKKNRFYILSFWIKRDGWREGEYPKVRIFGQEFYLNNIIGWGDWIRVFLLVNSGDNNKTVLHLINPGLHHKIYFDEICLKEFSPVPISPRGDIYTCWPDFVWSMPKNPYVLKIQIEISRYADFRSPFVIRDETNPVGNRLSPNFPIDGGKWFWRIKVYKNRRLIVISDPVSFNISAFFPIGIYGVPLQYLDVIKKAGFNSICLGNNIKSIKEALPIVSKYNLKVLLHPNIKERGAYNFIKSLRYSPDILAWYLEDEPEIRFIYPSYIWRFKQYIRSIDPSHPSLITLVRANMAKDYGDCADIIMVDPYPIPRRPVTWLSESIDRVKELFPYKPVWAVIQAFDWSAFPYGEEKRAWGRDPTYEEEKCLTYLAIIHGVRGLFYYTFKSGHYFIMERKRHWGEIKDLVKELNNIYPLLIAPKIYPISSVARSKNGNIHYIIKSVPSGFDIKKGYYLLAVNISPHETSSQIYIPPLNLKSAEEIFKQRRLPIHKNILQMHFSPYEVKIYFLR